MKDEIRQRFGASAATYDAAAAVQRRVALRLAKIAAPLLADGTRILEIGCGTGTLTERLLRLCRPSLLTLNDISGEMIAEARRKIGAQEEGPPIGIAQGDAERMKWPAADAVVSASAVQWFERPTAFLAKAAQTLPRGGVVALATYGPQTFHELRHGDAPNGYPTMDEWRKAMARHGFETVTTESETVTQTFASRAAMLRMIAMSGIGTRRCRQDAGGDGGGRELTWECLLLVGRQMGNNSYFCLTKNRDI